MSTKGIRKTLYLSNVKDQDILTYVKPLLEHYDFSYVIRELIRDGIKWRKSNNNPPQEKVIQSNTFPNKPSLKETVLRQKEVTKEDIEKRLDTF